MEDSLQKDLYKLVGASISSTPAEIRKAYRTSALRLHPDQNRDDPNANEKFAELVSAYELLSDEKQREAYDAKIRLRIEREEKLKQQSAVKQAQIRALLRREEEAAQRVQQRQQEMRNNFAKKSIQSELERFREELKAMQAAKKPDISRKAPAEEVDQHAVSVRIDRKRKPQPDAGELRQTFSKYGAVQDVIQTKKKRRMLITFESAESIRNVMQPLEVEFLDSLGLSVSARGGTRPTVASSDSVGTNGGDVHVTTQAAEDEDDEQLVQLSVSPIADMTSPRLDMPFEDLEQLVLGRLATMAEKQKQQDTPIQSEPQC